MVLSLDSCNVNVKWKQMALSLNMHMRMRMYALPSLYHNDDVKCNKMDTDLVGSHSVVMLLFTSHYAFILCME